jgi:ABC-type bacteriocin/lantibiotic exporter with double-glycine peptidase domain
VHTDEYEISIGREIAFCRKMVRRLKDSLERREKQYGMTTEAFLQALEERCLSEQQPMQSWNQEYQELQSWQKRLTEYEKALESLKWL